MAKIADKINFLFYHFYNFIQIFKVLEKDSSFLFSGLRDRYVTSMLYTALHVLEIIWKPPSSHYYRETKLIEKRMIINYITLLSNGKYSNIRKPCKLFGKLFLLSLFISLITGNQKIYKKIGKYFRFLYFFSNFKINR